MKSRSRIQTIVKRCRGEKWVTQGFRITGAVWMKFGKGPWKQMFTFDAPAVLPDETAADTYARTLRGYFRANNRLPNLCDGWATKS